MRIVIVLWVWLWLAGRADAGIADRPLARTASALLTDRLRIQLPIGMALEPAGADQTRAELALEDGRFVMIASETYQRAGTDLRAAVEAEMRRQGDGLARAKVDALERPRRLAVVTVRPPLPRAVADPNLVFAIYVASADDTVQVLGFYVFAAARGHAAEWAQLAARMAATLTAGDGALLGYTGLLELGAQRIRITCRDDCLIQVAITGYQLRTLRPLGDTQVCNLEIAGPPAASHRPRRPGRLLGQRVAWDEWHDDGGLHARTTMTIAGSESLRISCDATSQPGLASLLAVLDTMTLGDPRP